MLVSYRFIFFLYSRNIYW